MGAAVQRTAWQQAAVASSLPYRPSPSCFFSLPQEGPEANVHTPWHGKSPTSIAGTVVYIIANLPGKTHVSGGLRLHLCRLWRSCY